MASRKEQKEQARAQRLAKEQAAAERAGRVRRMQILGGVVALAIVVVVVLIVVSSSNSGSVVKPESAAAKAAAKRVDALLAGIPESGRTLGDSSDSNAFSEQQVAAYAAGLQGKAWYYIELMYNEQGKEDTGYVTQSYLEGLAKQIPGLNFKKWMSDRNLASLKNAVILDGQEGDTVDGNQASTPTVVIAGPKGQANPIVGLPQSGYSAFVDAINEVS
jgi:hypothetical protein